MMPFMIGADPEFFLVDAAGKLKSSIPVVKGTKHSQLMVEGGGIQRDNVAAEFSCDPAANEGQFVHHVGRMIKKLSEHVSPLKLRVLASADFPEEELDHPEAREFGCDPDYNSYTFRRNEIDPGAVASPLRSCGGHIHIGIKDGYPKTLAEDETGMGRIRMVKAMDFFVGIPSLVIDPDATAPRRRALYGKAGAHRPKEYGVEYRAVGNFWTRSPKTVSLVYRLTAMACFACDSGKDSEYFKELGGGNIEQGEAEIQRIINTSDVNAAVGVVQRFIEKHMKPETKALFAEVANKDLDLYGEWSLV